MKLTALLLPIAMIVGSCAADQLFAEEVTDMTATCPVDVNNAILYAKNAAQISHMYKESTARKFKDWEEDQERNDTKLVNTIRSNMSANPEAGRAAREF